MTQLAVVVTSKAHPHLVSLVILHQAFLMCWSASLPVGTNELYAPGTRTDTAGLIAKVTQLASQAREVYQASFSHSTLGLLSRASAASVPVNLAVAGIGASTPDDAESARCQSHHHSDTRVTV